ncbi:MAG: type II toxin-antitoxin system RelE/ParE family toxin [Chthoniobacter sp.]|uniref:type II toxin-antitoxin system RelE/ParE family toxin n=1 Tax=Chthoniobacter sp. TaxID=2510640 RepID=UPI0032A18BE0
MVFEETPTFTKRVIALLDDESYADLQFHLVQNPAAGDLIQHSGGFRKIRWAAKGRGKRGGVRIIYYWWNADDIISMVLIYPKNEQDDLTPAQLKTLKKLLED